MPFYLNSIDNMHCAPAVFKALIEYYCGEKLTWEAMDKLGHSIKGKGSWTTPYHLKLARCGVEVRVIESFDYRSFARDGKKYLESLGEKGKFYINHSNWKEAMPYVNDFLDAVHFENRKANIEEMDRFLEQGYLVGVELNSLVINDRAGFMLHYVLIKQKQGNKYLVNDPGGSNDGFENRLVDRSLLTKAMGGNEAQYEVDAFRKI